MCCLWFGSHSSFYMGIPSLPQNNFLSKIEVIDSSLPCTTTWEKPLSARSGNHRALTVMSDVTCPLPKPATAAKGKDSLYTLKSCWSWGVDGLFHRDGRGSGWVELCGPQYRALEKSVCLENKPFIWILIPKEDSSTQAFSLGYLPWPRAQMFTMHPLSSGLSSKLTGRANDLQNPK